METQLSSYWQIYEIETVLKTFSFKASQFNFPNAMAWQTMDGVKQFNILVLNKTFGGVIFFFYKKAPKRAA